MRTDILISKLVFFLNLIKPMVHIQLSNLHFFHSFYLDIWFKWVSVQEIQSENVLTQLFGQFFSIFWKSLSIRSIKKFHYNY